MSISKHSYPLRYLRAGEFISSDGKRFFIGFCAFWLFIALLELGQDYLSASLNGNAFMIGESLSYKLFWLLFIPLSLALSYGFSKVENSFSKLRYLTVSGLLVLSATLIHLILFSFFLYGISNLIHEDPVTLLYLLYEKLSTRLYIALSIYTVLVALYLLIKHRKSRQETTSKSDSKTITVKNGKSTLLVDTADITWIGSDGAYLDIHTNHKKHVVIDSLKNIINTLPENFKRIHKSTIVNINSVNELKSRGNGDYDVIMDDDQELRLSRNYAKQLKGLIL
ncbi:MAG: LytR/AlgR family response regulator transcription factor [Candidatus Halalkalibacterium sp. M3_1C_030]